MTSISITTPVAPTPFWLGFDEVTSSPANTIFSIFWAAVWVDSASRLVCDTSSCLCGERVAPMQFAQNGINFVYGSATLATWADSVKVISLGETALAVSKLFGYGASALIACFGIGQEAYKLGNAWELMEVKETEVEGYQKRNAALFYLVSRVCTLVLAILGIVAMFVGIPFFEVWNTSIFLLSFFSALNAGGTCQIGICPKLSS